MPPPLFRDTVMALYDKAKVRGHGSHRFDGALKVAAASLEKAEHITWDGKDYASIVLTPTGEKLDRRHAAHADAAARERRYDLCYARWAKDYPPP